MNVSRQQLHSLVDMVNPAEIGLIFQILMKFIPEEEPFPDEIEGIKLMDKQIANGELVSHNEIDWD